MRSGTAKRSDEPSARAFVGLALVLGALTATVIALGGVALAHQLTAGRALAHGLTAGGAPAQQCRDPYPSTRDATNPLDLATAPGADPLTGARFYVAGPAHSAAGRAIATMVGVTSSSSETWGHFSHWLHHGARALAWPPTRALPIAWRSSPRSPARPETQRFSSYSGGGGPGAISAQVQKIFCASFVIDAGSIPIIDTYFLHADLGPCPTPAQVTADMPVFHRRIDEMATATANRPAVYLLETDALGASSCVTGMGSMPKWEADLRYEIDAIARSRARGLDEHRLQVCRRMAVDASTGQQQLLRGGPAGGIFWPARAIGLAERANHRLGPTFASGAY